MYKNDELLRSKPRLRPRLQRDHYIYLNIGFKWNVPPLKIFRICL